MTAPSASKTPRTPDPRAEKFVAARRSGQALPAYPGSMPTEIQRAYAIQDDAINLWPDELAGWKVGRITGEWERKLGTDRLAGPVFRPAVHRVSGTSIAMPVFEGGFAAVEAEVIVVVGEDAPADKTDWSTDDARAHVADMRMGVEIASSPFAGINDHGPLVTISDFGNNYGLITGPSIPDWQDGALESWEFDTAINGRSVGRATPAGIPGGPVESFRFMLENGARRGRPLKAGMMILTGAVTGVHVARIGDRSIVSFRGEPAISCHLVAETVDALTGR